MNREVNTPNIVVDDNYRMLVKRLTHRYAGRNATVYTDADAIEQERSDARARAIAPEAYRMSSLLGDSPEMYKSNSATGERYMTTDDYLVYFSKCHDTFDAINYCSLRTQAPEVSVEDEQPRVIVNRKRMEMLKNQNATPAKVVRKAEKQEAERRSAVSTGFGFAKGRAFTAFAAVAASVAIVIGGVFAISPSSEVNSYNRNVPEEEIVNFAELEGQEILQNHE